ncbi:MAG: desulfoferrodoxin family protein [Clostridiaceae bacterium]|nr:desulfoferrodoxin family protein [Clostridiaceae bacterium]
MCEIRFFRCKHCGNIVGLIHDSGVPVVCCGEPMEHLVPNTVDASQEKHVPVVTVKGDLVTVHIGAADHPMVEEHYIQWVYLQTDRGGHRKCLAPGEKPEVTFALHEEKPLAAFAYCNLHGLWTKEL